MDMRLLAIVKSKQMNIIGYRILDVDTATIKDVGVADILRLLKAGKFGIDGLGISGNSLIGTRGSIDRYAVIIGDRLIGKSPLLILSQLTDNEEVVGYRVADWKGSVLNATLRDIIRYATTNGISNGALKSIGSKQFISPIRGEYTRVNIGNTESKKGETVRGSDSDIEDIEKTLWTEEQFIRYMKDNKYEYKYSMFDKELWLQLKCPSATILKYPNNVTSIDTNTASDELSSARTLIIPPSVKNINMYLMNKVPLLERIVIQNGATDIKFSGLRVTGNEKTLVSEIVFPNTLESIKGGIQGFSELKTLDLSNTKIKTVESSFNSLSSLDSLVIPEGLSVISDSFKRTSSLKKVTLPSSLTEIIDDSFCLSGIEELDLSKCTKLRIIENRAFNRCEKLRRVILPEGLEVIKNSFMDCASLTDITFPSSLTDIGEGSFNYNVVEELDLSKCTKLGVIGYSTFSCCRKLKSVKLPKGLKTLGHRAFHMCRSIESINVEDIVGTIGENAIDDYRADSVKVSSELMSIGRGSLANVNTLIVGSGISEIAQQFAYKNNFKEIVLPDGIKKIGESAFSGCARAAKINIPTDIEVIDYKAFSNCMRLTDIRFDELSRLKYIGERAFECCYELKNVILPDGLETIGNECFIGCEGIQSLLIPSTVTKIGCRAIGSWLRKDVFITYVFEGTEGLKYCKRNKLRHVVLKSYDEIYEYIGDRSIDSRKAAKLRMLLSGNRDTQELVEDKYINHADKLYKLLGHLEQEFIGSTDNSRLDTSKFVDIPVSEVSIVKSLMGVLYNSGQQAFNSNTGGKVILNDEFITASNFLTKLMQLSVNQLSANSIKGILDKEVSDNKESKSYTVSSTDDVNSISSQHVTAFWTYKDKYSCIITIMSPAGNKSDRYNMIPVVIINNKIVFSCLLNSDCKSGMYSMLTSTNKANEDKKYPISNLLSIGDLAISKNGECMIDKSPIPYFMTSKVIENMANSFVNVYASPKTNIGDIRQVVFICRDTGKLIYTQCTSGYDIIDRVYRVSSMLITDIVDFDDVSEKDKKLILTGIETYNIQEKFKSLTLGDKYTNNLKSLDGAYDTKNSYEGDVGMILNKLDIKSLGQLNLDMYKIITCTGFYKEIRKKEEDVSKILHSVERIELEGGKYILTEYRLKHWVKSASLYDGKGKYLVGIDTGNQNDSKTGRYFVSSDSLIENIGMLKSISMESKEPDILTNTDQCSLADYNDLFIDIHKYHDSDTFNDYTYKIVLALSRSTGTAYIVCKKFKLLTLKSVYKVLRFKTLEDAIKQCKCLDAASASKTIRTTYRLYTYMFNAIHEIDGGPVSSKSNKVKLMRDAIIGGIPNGHYLDNVDMDMFNSLAKQK